jgi:hypothetical protein
MKDLILSYLTEIVRRLLLLAVGIFEELIHFVVEYFEGNMGKVRIGEQIREMFVLALLPRK